MSFAKPRHNDSQKSPRTVPVKSRESGKETVQDGPLVICYVAMENGGKWPSDSWWKIDLPIFIVVIFHSYVSLPEGNMIIMGNLLVIWCYMFLYSHGPRTFQLVWPSQLIPGSSFIRFVSPRPTEFGYAGHLPCLVLTASCLSGLRPISLLMAHQMLTFVGSALAHYCINKRVAISCL